MRLRYVAEVMSTQLFTVTSHTSVLSAQRLAAEYGTDYLLVLESTTLAGIVSEDDLTGADPDCAVASCMSSPVYCVSPATTVTDAVAIMNEKHVSCLPVIAGSFLVGVVTRTELASSEAASEPVLLN